MLIELLKISHKHLHSHHRNPLSTNKAGSRHQETKFLLEKLILFSFNSSKAIWRKSQKRITVWATHNWKTVQWRVLRPTALTLGLHNMTAAKALNVKYRNNPHFKGRHSRVYCGLNDEEALWLVSRHNLTAAMRHEMSFFEEVSCNKQPNYKL